MAKKQFKAESKKLLDLMINSIYTHREIFLREIISNSSDALDKLYYTALQSGDTGIKRSDFNIEIKADKDARTLTISDNGIGMTAQELETNLGTIAKSGSQAFKAQISEDAEAETDAAQSKKIQKMTDIIGQFGVGFYASFMVSDQVRVVSKAFGSDEANQWLSNGADGYTVSPAERDSVGTDIILTIKPDQDGENYSQYLEDWKIKELIIRYSDYIHYPIKFNGETINTMEPIWKRQKSKVNPEDYNNYYKDKFNDFKDPARVIRTSVEGVSSYTALLFIPSHTPYDYYTKEYEKGLQLYSSGVMIMDKCKELLPDYYGFVKGLVDSQDLSLNISRETLQQDKQLKNIAKNLEKKIKKELLDFMKKDREGYENFFKEFGRQIKFGIYENFGLKKDELSDLLLFYSSTEKKPVSLDEYIERMKEGQTDIYYAPGETVEKIDMLPQTEAAKAKGYEILYVTEDVDEFCFKIMRAYKEKNFKSISEEDFSESVSEEEKKEIEKKSEENKSLINFIKETLEGEIVDVKISTLLKDSAVTLTSKGEISIEMEKTMNKLQQNLEEIKAEKILEINLEHPAVMSIKSSLDAENKELAASEIRLLYAQARLISGLDIKDPVLLAKDINSVIAK